MEKIYKIEFERTGCIGAAICCAASRKFWVFNDNEQKVDLTNCNHNNEKDIQTSDIEEKDFAENYDAAISCPVNVIHIIDLRNGKKII